METVLVTGGCGLIGQHICSGLLKKGFEVIAVDREEGIYNQGKLHYSFIQAAPTDKNTIAEIFENNQIDVFIHAACTVDNDLGPIVTDKEVNESAQCDKFIYRYAMTENVKKVILLSTDQVYDFPKTREPLREDSDLKIVTNYAKMKHESEKALIAEMAHHKKVMVCITRSAPVYTLNFTDNLVSRSPIRETAQNSSTVRVSTDSRCAASTTSLTSFSALQRMRTICLMRESTT